MNTRADKCKYLRPNTYPLDHLLFAVSFCSWCLKITLIPKYTIWRGGAEQNFYSGRGLCRSPPKISACVVAWQLRTRAKEPRSRAVRPPHRCRHHGSLVSVLRGLPRSAASLGTGHAAADGQGQPSKRSGKGAGRRQWWGKKKVFKSTDTSVGRLPLLLCGEPASLLESQIYSEDQKSRDDHLPRHQEAQKSTISFVLWAVH